LRFVVVIAWKQASRGVPLGLLAFVCLGFRLRVIPTMNYKTLFGFSIAAFALSGLLIFGGLFLTVQGAGQASLPFSMVGGCWGGIALVAGCAAQVCKSHAKRIEQLEHRLQETLSSALT
jgi:hypothetical protein